MKVKYLFTLFLVLSLLIGCSQESYDIKINSDRVTEGKYHGIASSPRQLKSNYPMDIHRSIQQPIIFKLSLNGEDNEAGFGQNHELSIPPGVQEFYAPLLYFGVSSSKSPADPAPLDHAVNVHFRVDLRPQLLDFAAAGFTVTPTNDTLYADIFQGLYLAGSSDPLQWIWNSPTPPEQLRFSDTDLDSIFELTIRFEPPQADMEERSWELVQDISEYPCFSSPEAPLLEAITNLAMEETILNIRSDGAFSAGKLWQGIWTRDVSYAAQLSLAYLFPDNVKTSLRSKLDRSGRIIQDTGTGGSWPVSSDRHLWTLAAWEVFLATGDKTWLDEIRKPVIQALREDLLWNRDPVSGMLQGETSFEDWREQTYPAWMTPTEIHASHSLSTNIIFKRALEIGLALAKNNREVINSWPALITRMDQNILNHFWNKALDAPASYVIANPVWLPASHRDLLGESLGILYCNSFARLAPELVATYPRTQYGSPVISRQLPHIPPYHNQAIWPFVESYALLAAKKVGNQAAYTHSFNSLTRAATLFLTHKENYAYTTGRPDETAVNSDRQLWSDAGWLSAIYKGLFGISISYDFDNDSFDLLLAPNNPFQWDQFSLSRLTLHDTQLNINLEGQGSVVSSILINGVSVEPGQPIPLRGDNLSIVVKLTTLDSQEAAKLTLATHILPEIPQVNWDADTLSWHSETREALLEVNGRLVDTLISSPVTLSDSLTGFFSLRSLDSVGIQSLPSQPHYRGPSASLILNSKAPYFLELGQENAFITMTFSVPAPGNYLLRFIYTNGTGPINSGNSCGLAKLQINDWWLEQMISFPQTGSWDTWQATSWVTAQFHDGKNTLNLNQETLPVTNMNGNLNLFRVQSMEIIPISE